MNISKSLENLTLDQEAAFISITDEEASTIQGGWAFFAAVGAGAAVYGVLPENQKQWVNRRFINIGQLFQPIPVY